MTDNKPLKWVFAVIIDGREEDVEKDKHTIIQAAEKALLRRGYNVKRLELAHTRTDELIT